MQFDNGEVLQGLQINWTFMGATLMEWAAGFMVFILVSLFANSDRIAVAVPFMVAGWVLTTVSLASLRNLFPDQERGVRNAVMTACGFPPLDIPAPAALQPKWSGAPLTEVVENWKFTKLGLNELMPSFEMQYLDVEEE